MTTEGKRTLLATLLCIGVMLVWFRLYKYMYPPTPATSQPSAAEVATTAPGDEAVADVDHDVDREGEGPAESQGTGSDTASASSYQAVGTPTEETVTLGDDRQNRKDWKNPYEMKLELSSRLASVETVTLSRHRGKVAKSKKNPDHDPYPLMKPVTDPETKKRFTSFGTEAVEIDGESVSLGGLNWQVLDEGLDDEGAFATFSVTIENKLDDSDVLCLRKTYRLKKGSPEFEIDYEIENCSKVKVPKGKEHSIGLTMSGPIGIREEDIRYDYRRVVTAVVGEDGRPKLGSKPTRREILKSTEDGKPHVKVLRPGEGNHTIWAAVGNKYFGAILAPRDSTQAEGSLGQLVKVTARNRFASDDPADDLTYECVLKPDVKVGPETPVKIALDVYCGPKNKGLQDVSPSRHYYKVTEADRTFCNIEVISTAMLWLLTKLQAVFGNFGISIIVLVIIVKLLLHPISKRGQIHMMTSQKKMAQVKPKLDALQKQFKNDKQKLQQEQMRLYREEGVNPAGTIFGCLPMMLQMPIWVALWTTLNTNVDMRHQPFFWWIRDLSSPDSLIPFAGSYSIPLIGGMIGPITSFNLLPIIMAITMYTQQKLSQKLTKPDRPAKPTSDAEGRPVVDQMAQQQKIMGFMMIFMGIIFYNFPSGLNLYILTSNLLGMLEQWQIRTKIREQEAHGGFEAKPKAKAGSGGVQKMVKWLEKKSEEARVVQSQRERRVPKKRGKKRAKL